MQESTTHLDAKPDLKLQSLYACYLNDNGIDATADENKLDADCFKTHVLNQHLGIHLAHLLCYKGELEKLKTELEALPIAEDSKAWDQLFIAATQGGQLAVLKHLLGLVTTPSPETKPETSVNQAAFKKKYLYEKLKRQFRAKDYSSLLHIAARKGDLSVAKYLVETWPALLFEQQRNGYKPILEAAKYGQIDMVDYLANPTGAYFNDKELERRLSKAGCEQAWTVLHVAANHARYKLARHLLTKYPFLNCNKTWCDHPLTVAARAGDVAMVELLANPSGAKPSEKQKQQVAHYINNAVGHPQPLVLTTAAANGHLPVVKSLLKMCPLEKINPKAYSSAIFAATKAGHLAIVKFLVNPNQQPMTQAQLETRLASFKNNWGNTLLHQAAKAGHLPIAEYLVNGCWDLLSRQDNKFESLPIREAAAQGHLPVIQYLIAAQYGDLADAAVGAKLASSTDEFGCNVLHWAAHNGDLATVKFLSGKYPNLARAKNNKGELPVSYARRAGKLEAAKVIATSVNASSADYVPRNRGPR